MTRTPARPDLQVHRSAMRLDPAVLVEEGSDLLGAKLVAYLGGGQGDARGARGTSRAALYLNVRWR